MRIRQIDLESMLLGKTGNELSDLATSFQKQSDLYATMEQDADKLLKRYGIGGYVVFVLGLVIENAGCIVLGGLGILAAIVMLFFSMRFEYKRDQYLGISQKATARKNQLDSNLTDD